MPLTRHGCQRRGRSLSPAPEIPQKRRRAQTLVQPRTSRPYQRLGDSPGSRGTQHLSAPEGVQPVPVPEPRAALRDLHIFDNNAPARRIGGLHVTNGITNRLLFEMIEMIINVPSGTWDLHNENGHRVLRDESHVQPGNYFIASDPNIELVEEDALLRAFSGNPAGAQTAAFTNAVRHRDRGCIITKEAQGELMAQAGIWSGFDAAHIFPLAYSTLWVNQGFNTTITAPGFNGDNINSVQNGILLRTDIHQLFDNYHFSISTKDDYKIVCFMPDNKRIAGTHLSREFLSDPQRPPDALFDWHFRQAVLSNMKSGGQPAFEHNYPSGSDMVGQIIDGPEPEGRMEFELFTRLANFQSRR